MSLKERIESIAKCNDIAKAERIRMLSESAFSNEARNELVAKQLKNLKVLEDSPAPMYVKLAAIVVGVDAAYTMAQQGISMRKMMGQQGGLHKGWNPMAAGGVNPMAAGMNPLAAMMQGGFPMGMNPMGFGMGMPPLEGIDGGDEEAGPFKSGFFAINQTSPIDEISLTVNRDLCKQVLEYIGNQVSADLDFLGKITGTVDVEVARMVKDIVVIRKEIKTFDARRKEKEKEIDGIINQAILEEEYPDFVNLTKKFDEIKAITDKSLAKIISEAGSQHAALNEKLRKVADSLIVEIKSKVDKTSADRIIEMKSELEALLKKFEDASKR